MAALWARMTLLLALLFAAAPAFAQIPASDFPALTGRVVDAAGILSPEQVAGLDAKLAGLETQSQRQLVVATIPDLKGYDIADYGYQLGRAWGIGDKGRNDGAILLIAPNDRKLRIEVGYGLEGTLTDAVSSVIINQVIVPKIKAGDMPGGIAAGTDELIKFLQLPPDQAAEVAKQAQAQQARRTSSDNGGLDFPTVLFLMFILFFVVLPMMRSMRHGGRGYRRSGFPPVMIFPGGGGGGWGGGGGFGGGGGSFGGGGASGSW